MDGAVVDQRELGRFTDSLTHRGPDGRGTYIDEKAGLGLGHRRLSILDLTDSGHQPMSYGDGRYWITYNGEVYNFLELRKELENLSHRFHSESDTEVILASYAQWGEDCHFKFNGMWAFSIWDSVERKLFLSRDRFGVKPLHYLYDGKYFVFASELKAFFSLNPPLRPDFDPTMVARFSSSDTVEETLLKGVKILGGGHCLILKEGSTPYVRRWWNTLDHLVDVPKSFDDQVQQYKELFFDACKIRMRSDVPIATALSGGLDSSSVLCAMAETRSKSSNGQRLAEEWQRAFVLLYSSTSHNERHYADKVIQFTDVQPVYKEIDPDQISPDDLVSAIYSLEAIQEPAIGPWLIYREMSDNGIAVSMDGHGGDETLAGYHHYPEVALNDAIYNLFRWRDIKETWRGLYDHEIPDGLIFSEPSYVQFVKSKLPKLPNGRKVITDILSTSPRLYQGVRSVYREFKNKASHNPFENMQEQWVFEKVALVNSILTENSTKSDFDHLNGQLYDDFHRTILPTILRNFDRLSMAHGVEIRAPFMDWRLVCYTFSLPSSSKLGSGFTKRILRESMRNVLPEEIRVRKSKIGFASPMNEWYRHALKPFVLDSVNSQEFLESSIWNGPVIRDFVEDSFKKEDYRNAQKGWKYIQAMHLMSSFHQTSLH
tara:strand:+ start:267 stop:2237 length:1971 start_codon:yes stop_codon:yes gene_type:complete